ncbi:MAG: DUF5350 domain-containing protein [Methanomicrobiales archaeon]|nr:DUF5350 domain-containing protein [Methanomicrobiales archaeon]MDI6875692.1 DUF5350 domain-containing protein [Methanomicrobiales archaeon]
MGKTGSVNWCQVKGVHGQIRLVPQKEAEAKKPGPNQRYKSSAALKKLTRSSEGDDRRGGRGGRRPGARGGRRGGSRGQEADGLTRMVRRHIVRAKSSVLGAKGKARK